MGENSKIEWTIHTFNGWFGCTKVSEGCKNCYAENLMDQRLKKVHWGKGNPRKRTGEANWNMPVKWNEKAKAENQRSRVFCSSLSDWLDPEVPIEWLIDLLDLIRTTTHLDWLLLTKRPEVWEKRIGEVLDKIKTRKDGSLWSFLYEWWIGNKSPSNVWLGTSVENQEMAEKRIPELLGIPSKLKFLSCEPLLGELNLLQMEGGNDEFDCLVFPLEGSFIMDGMNEPSSLKHGGIDWVIVGGESGPNARPMNPDWVVSIQEQCELAEVPFFFKQWGEYAPKHEMTPENRLVLLLLKAKIKRFIFSKENHVYRIGKKISGNLLGGKTYMEYPTRRKQGQYVTSNAAIPCSTET